MCSEEIISQEEYGEKSRGKSRGQARDQKLGVRSQKLKADG